MTFQGNSSSEKTLKMAVEKKTNTGAAEAKQSEKRKENVQKRKLGHTNRRRNEINQKEETREI